MASEPRGADIGKGDGKEGSGSSASVHTSNSAPSSPAALYTGLSNSAKSKVISTPGRENRALFVNPLPPLEILERGSLRDLKQRSPQFLPRLDHTGSPMTPISPLPPTVGGPGTVQGGGGGGGQGAMSAERTERESLRAERDKDSLRESGEREFHKMRPNGVNVGVGVGMGMGGNTSRPGSGYITATTTSTSTTTTTTGGHGGGGSPGQSSASSDFDARASFEFPNTRLGVPGTPNSPGQSPLPQEAPELSKGRSSGKWGLKNVINRLRGSTDNSRDSASPRASSSNRSSLDRHCFADSEVFAYYEHAKLMEDRGPDSEWSEEVPNTLLLAGYNFGFLSRRDYCMCMKVDAIPIMKAGTSFLKFSKNGSPHFRLLKLSDDLRYLTYSSHKKQKDIYIDLRHGFRVVLGQSWNAFPKGPRALALTSFTILSRDISVDLVAKDAREYSIWTEGLSDLVRLLKDPKVAADLQQFQHQQYLANNAAAVAAGEGGDGGGTQTITSSSPSLISSISLVIKIPYFPEESNTSYLAAISRYCGPLTKLDFFHPAAVQDRVPPLGKAGETVAGRRSLWTRVDLLSLLTEGTMFVCYYHGSEKQPKYMKLSLDTSPLPIATSPYTKSRDGGESPTEQSSLSGKSSTSGGGMGSMGSHPRPSASSSGARIRSNSLRRGSGGSRGKDKDKDKDKDKEKLTRPNSLGVSETWNAISHYRIQLWQINPDPNLTRSGSGTGMGVGHKGSNAGSTKDLQDKDKDKDNKGRSSGKNSGASEDGNGYSGSGGTGGGGGGDNKVLKAEYFVKDILRIQLGQATARFTRAETPRMLSQVSFSLVFRGDPFSSKTHSTIDLIAHSQDAFETWTLGLQALMRAHRNARLYGTPTSLEHLYVEVPLPRHREAPSTKIGDCIRSALNVKVSPTEVFLAINPHIDEPLKQNPPGTTLWYDPSSVSPFSSQEMYLNAAAVHGWPAGAGLEGGDRREGGGNGGVLSPPRFRESIDGFGYHSTHSYHASSNNNNANNNNNNNNNNATSPYKVRTKSSTDWEEGLVGPEEGTRGGGSGGTGGGGTGGPASWGSSVGIQSSSGLGLARWSGDTNGLLAGENLFERGSFGVGGGGGLSSGDDAPSPLRSLPQLGAHDDKYRSRLAAPNTNAKLHSAQATLQPPSNTRSHASSESDLEPPSDGTGGTSPRMSSGISSAHSGLIGQAQGVPSSPDKISHLAADNRSRNSQNSGPNGKEKEEKKEEKKEPGRVLTLTMRDIQNSLENLTNTAGGNGGGLHGGLAGGNPAMVDLPPMEFQDNTEIFQGELGHSVVTSKSSELDSKGGHKERYTMFYL